MSKTRRPKREGPYLWAKILKKSKKGNKQGAKASKVQKSTKTGKATARGRRGIGMYLTPPYL